MRVQTGDLLGSQRPMGGLGNYVQDMRPASILCFGLGSEYGGGERRFVIALELMSERRLCRQELGNCGDGIRWNSVA
jgi:hypothetical protein